LGNKCGREETRWGEGQGMISAPPRFWLRVK
jgi:hypothetical protein